MAKKIKTIIKLQCPAGKANPAPPVGPALGQHGLNIMDFCTKFNAATKQMGDTIIPAEITVYEDRTFDFKLKKPPVSIMIKKAIKLEKGSGVPNRDKVGKISKDQIKKIAEEKMSDLDARTVENAMKTIEGTARSMGVTVE
ncbi:MAG: 50S ribosomal protein L11 [Patescibacteria group bacterium]|nr:50S ribosomal protein L11 [Patescibacteria group bacterium]